MKQKTKKVLTKRFVLTNPKGRKGKVEFKSPLLSKKLSKRRRYRVFREKMEKSLKSLNQSNKIERLLK